MQGHVSPGTPMLAARRRLPVAFLLAATLAGCAAGARRQKASGGEEQRRPTPVQAHGRLQVCGRRICDRAGEPVQLRGMSLFWSNTGWGGERFYDANVAYALHFHAGTQGPRPRARSSTARAPSGPRRTPS